MPYKEAIPRLMALFNGLARAYGTYRVTGTDTAKDGKRTGTALTVHGQVTSPLWLDHLEGRQGLGVIPIRDDSTCVFGAIDVDVYHLTYSRVIDNVKRKKFPLVPCRTKSGGLHLYLFSTTEVPAAVMREKLAAMAASLGFGDSEIFPKQGRVLAERGDLGSWLNMPYFDAARTERYALDDRSEALGLPAFLDLAEGLRTDVAALRVKAPSEGDLVDGPPCLQHLFDRGEVTEGVRNEVLFNLAVYLKRALPDTWRGRLEELNAARFRPPLGKTEVGAVVKSVSRREYLYGCAKPPLKSYCDRGTCRGRKFGIGAASDMPVLAALTKYDTQPPTWFVDVEDGGRIELSTEDLQNQLRFQRRCMDFLNVMPPVIKPDEWRTLVQGLMEKMSIVSMPFDASALGQLMGHLEAFCTVKAQARVREEILLGKPWSEDGRHYFRLSDLMDYLERKRFREYKVFHVTRILKERGAEHLFLRLRGKGVNIWSVPAFERHSDEPLPLPKIAEDSPI